jgi:hypothetical protein
MARVLFGGLALVDAALLLYFVFSYDWFVFGIDFNNESIAGIFIIPLLWALLIAEKAFFAAYAWLVGWATVREITGKRDAHRGLAVLASLVLLPSLIGATLLWVLAAGVVIHGPPGFLIDRLTLFDGLAQEASKFGGLFGTASLFSGSIGRMLVILLGAAYLSEKYLLTWWRIRWPLPLLPLVAVGWVGWSVHDGEQRLRAFVSAQQWRAISAEQPWLAALDACHTLGEGWRLPQREELARYLSTQPPEIKGWKGSAWTATASDAGWVVAVDLEPRRSGRWNRDSEPTRDESLCELRPTQPGYANDWFVRLRPRVCEATTLSAYLYTPGRKAAAYQSGNIGVTQPNAAAICVRPAANAGKIGVRERRGYKDEKDWFRAADFVAYMKDQCGLSPDRDRAACFVYAPDLPEFEETGDERLMRAFCEMDRNGEGCDRYATMMAKHPDTEQRVARYRDLACKRGYASACAAR